MFGHALALAQKDGKPFGVEHIEQAVRLFRHETFSQVFGNAVPANDDIAKALADAAAGADAPQKKLTKLNGTQILDSIGDDLTIKASEGNVTAAVGREHVFNIINKRLNQAELNSVILVGDKGTGKTQILEGLALLVAQGQMPTFENGRVFNITGTDLAAGKKCASGNCPAQLPSPDEVIRKLIADIEKQAKAEPKVPILLVVDEVHTLFETNPKWKEALLPYMSRGQLRMLAVTTPDKYKDHFENHAITDRFHKVDVPEPSKEETVPMVMEKAKRFEKFFGATMLASAAQVATELSHLNGKFRRPRAATDLLDLAFSDLKLSLQDEPPELRVARRELARLQGFQKDVKGDDEGSKRVKAQLFEDVQVMAQNVAALEKHSKSERQLVDQQMSLSQELEKLFQQGESSGAEVDKLTAQIEELKKKIGGLRVTIKERNPAGGWKDKVLTRLYNPVLDGVAVAKAVSSTMPGAPPLAQLLAHLAPRGKVDIEAEAGKRVFGQDHILKSLADYYRIREAGLGDENRPIGVHLIPGLTGTGKTEACLAHAEAAFGPGLMHRVDCNELQHGHEVAKQLGSPPGYVGHGEGAALIEALKKMGFRGVLLLDEIEKAHPNFLLAVMNLLDTGYITDNKGNRHDCRNLQIVMTSNLGAEIMEQYAGDGEYTDQQAVMAGFDQYYRTHGAFRPEIRNRIDTVDIANPLSKATQSKIIDREVKTMFDQQARQRNIRLELDGTAKDFLMSVGFDRTRGGRGVKVQLTQHLRTPLVAALTPKEVNGRTEAPDGKWLSVLWNKDDGLHVAEMSEQRKAEILADDQAEEAAKLA
jgi:ATP-dependent Clp protease ATP-binding subunit ClpB